MRRKETRRRLSAVLMPLLCLVLMAGCENASSQKVAQTIPAAAGTSSVATTQAPTKSTVPPAVVESYIDPIVVSTVRCEFSYPGELADLLLVKDNPSTGADGLSFYAKLSVGEVSVFTLYYDSDQGDIVQMFSDASGNQRPFAFLMHDNTAGLGEEDLERFYLAQESVNHVIQSLSLK